MRTEEKMDTQTSMDSAPLSKTKSAKSELVLQAARSHFLEYGYDPTSMDQIAREAGVSKATLYAHFDSKETLLYEMMQDEFQRCGPEPLWNRKGEFRDIEQSLREIARRFTSIFLSDDKLAFHRLVMTNASRFPKIAEIFMNGGPRRQQSEIQAFLEKAVDEGMLEISNMPLAVKQFVCLVQGDLPLSWALSLKPPSPKEYNAQIEGGVRVFLAAYGAKANE